MHFRDRNFPRCEFATVGYGRAGVSIPVAGNSGRVICNKPVTISTKNAAAGESEEASECGPRRRTVGTER